MPKTSLIATLLRTLFPRHQWTETTDADDNTFRECACGQREKYNYDDWGHSWLRRRAGDPRKACGPIPQPTAQDIAALTQ